MKNRSNLLPTDNSTCPLCEGVKLNRLTKRHSLSILVCPSCGFHSGLTHEASNDSGAVSTAPEHFQMLVEADVEWKAVMDGLLDQRMAFLLKHFGLQPKNWLEIGPGNGGMGELVERRGGYWLGVEIDDMMSRRMQAAGKNVVLADFSNTHLPDLLCANASTKNGFDIVFFSQVLEHVKNPRVFLNNAYQALRPGGVIYVDVPNNDGLTALIRKVNKRSHGYGEIVPPHHMMAYGRKTLAGALKQQGFENVLSFACSYRDPTFGLVHACMDNRVKMKAIWFLSRLPGWGGNLVGIASKPAEI
jgi:2-polyprenyl-3-methyl-5-hydroxy-6-metoxy-1,4-benzoquinol methylase